VLFDRICAENGIRHLLTAPRSPTTTGKVERWHKTMRAEFLAEHDYKHATVADGPNNTARSPPRTGGPASTRMRRPGPTSRPRRCAVGLPAEP
jgi:transposase InsO family protein